MLFLGHRPPNDISPAQRVSRQGAEDLHDLLLVNNAAVGHVQNAGQQRVQIGYPLRMVAVLDVFGNGIHRAGTVQGDHGDEILQRLRAQLDQHVLHAAGFVLEYAVGAALRQHPVHRRVVIRHMGD